MKENPFSKILGLHANRRKKQVILTTGEVTIKAVMYRDDDDDKALIKALICQALFTNVNELKFNFGEDSDKTSVTMTLTMLSQMI